MDIKNKLDQINSEIKLENIKNNNILKKLFEHIIKKKKLSIYNYNKNIQQRMNITFNDYKEYSEAFSSIEIELIPYDFSYGVFINIDEHNEKYYHIYFNNIPEEIKRKYIEKKRLLSKNVLEIILLI